MSERDLFANFDRMRRELDELFGDVLERTGLTRRSGGFAPAVDVVYSADPPRVIVIAELAGVDPAALDVEIHGRQLIVSGRRELAAVEGDVYQQVEIERGDFRRVVELGVDVHGEATSARYEDGLLRVELPLRQDPERSRIVPIEGAAD